MLSQYNAFLENSFQILNKVYFDSALPSVIITIQSCKKAYGYITTRKIWKRATEQYYEINITAEYLARPIEEVLSTLLHEMVHLYCMVNNINDTSKNGTYHNKRFKEEAEKRDLKIEYVNYYGYTKTSPTEKLIEVIHEYGLNQSIEYYRQSESFISTGNDDDKGTGEDGISVKRKSSTRKYICPSCKVSVRATKNLYIICGTCMVTMLRQE